ncbi:hypothetical protein BH20ACI4_BH20ACI4_31640 [soil metagenome]
MQNRILVKIKLTVISLAVLIAVFGFYGFSEKFQKVGASASGPTPSHTNAPGESNCTACHGSFPVNSGTGNMIISGLPANYKPNQQIPVTVTLNQAQAVVYGFQLTAVDSQGRKVGTFTLPAQMPPQMQIVEGIVNNQPRDYVEHTSSGIIPTQFDTKSWTFTFTTPSQRVGKIGFYAAGNAANSDGGPDGDYIYTTSKATLSGTAVSNFDGDGASDFAVYRPSSGVWYSLNSSDGGFRAAQFGISEDKIAPGEFDGDGKNDLAVFRPSTGVWYIQRSSDNGFTAVQFGSNGDIPVSGDYDGDLKNDIAVWRPSTGVWYIWRSSDNAFDFRTFGISTDKIAQGDYDADGKTDIAVYRPSTGVWYIWKSSDNGYLFTGFGLDGDKPVQGDYDGDGKTDIAVFRPSNSVFYIQQSTNGFTAVQWGISTDRPVPADYDGDGKTDIAVYRDGVWYALRSSDNAFFAVTFGLAEDKPVPGGYIAE